MDTGLGWPFRQQNDPKQALGQNRGTIYRKGDLFYRASGLCPRKWECGWDQKLGVPRLGGKRSRVGLGPVGATENSAQHQTGNLGLTLHGYSFQSMISNNTLVMVCVNAASPFLLFNTSLNCTTGIGRQLLAKRPWPAPLATSDLPDHHAFLLPYSLLPGLLPVSEHLISQGQTHHSLPRDRQLVPLPAACVPSES